MTNRTAQYFHPFQDDISHISLPEKFTFPFFYTPHPLCLKAVKELQLYLEKDFKADHNFGINPNSKGVVIGKMFGVLVVKNSKGELGHLWAFSGKIADSNDFPDFVPPVYDTLNPDDHYKKMESILIKMSEDIMAMEADPDYEETKRKLDEAKEGKEAEISALKEKIQKAKAIRDQKRKKADNNPKILYQLSEESKKEQIELKYIRKKWNLLIDEHNKEFNERHEIIESLKNNRKNLSTATQQFIFEQYSFLNIEGKTKNLLDIFDTSETAPPAGAGECAMPKLLQYAFNNDLQPIAMSEFWWGQSPPSEVRQHKQFYPSCRSKCEPILAHMLEGLEVEDNPMLKIQDLSHEIKIIYEDDYLLLVDKPSEMLSVPGKNPHAISLYDVLKVKYPHATGPLLVHRLDMSTSGIILIAKSKEIHENLQAQFIRRTVKKRYTALLDGLLKQHKGRIELPIRVDLDNRPRQLVCYEYGKMAITEYETILVENCRTKVYFYPITGRTHQLRVHSAHHLGLNAAIVGDDLYGNSDKRLHLHANQLEFRHPITKEIMTIDCPEPF